MSGTPFSDFGNQLKEFRKKAKESIAEVSGAVELDAGFLADIEAGKNQPTEDIVLLLISHFALKDDEALKMWELAGYDQQSSGVTSIVNDDKGPVQTAFISPNDAKILYTDMVHVNANKYGVIVNFLQGLGTNNQPVSVSRIGMSHEHAESLLKVLEETIRLSKKHNQGTEKA